jgi:hypothetical protein
LGRIQHDPLMIWHVTATADDIVLLVIAAAFSAE